MKNPVIIALCFLLIIFSCVSCASDSTAAYKDVIERYMNALIHADTDAFLDSLDPNGPLYPEPEAMQKLRDTEEENALRGESVVKNISIIEESEESAQVRSEVFTRIDFDNTDDFSEKTYYFIFKLSLVNDEWLIYDLTTE